MGFEKQLNTWYASYKDKPVVLVLFCWRYHEPELYLDERFVTE